MRRTCFILFAFCLTACASQAPLDDAYHWPDKTAHIVVSETQPAPAVKPAAAAQPAQTGPARPETPSMEIISAKDTTITVRIKR
ncbi:MAG: hypothetical protein J6T71_06270 [Paludibacteraceae bacterium]|nr:hypothetical protein [Paludibacteraceae bacterium]